LGGYRKGSEVAHALSDAVPETADAFEHAPRGELAHQAVRRRVRQARQAADLG